MKKLLLIFALGFLLIPQVSLAYLDQRCWTRDDCKTYRKDFGAEDAEGGFYDSKTHTDARAACLTDVNGKDVSGREIGFCLPVGETVTSISFGGRTKFSNIGDFIQFIYQYAFIIGSVVAVMVIIVAGVMYIFSGGNSNTVGQAKKKIYGSIIGLVLMAVSYTILHTINPYLVNLRLPSIWAINTAGIAPVRCELLDKGTEIAIASLNNSSSTLPLEQAKWETIQDNTITGCGNQYYVGKTNGQMCTGSECPDVGQVCYQPIRVSQKGCFLGNVAGLVYSSSVLTNFIQDSTLASIGSSIFAEGWEYPWLSGGGNNNIELYAVCKDGQYKEVSTKTNEPDATIYSDEKKFRQEYWLIIEPGALNKNYCDTAENLKGYALYLSINEEGSTNNDEHFLGREPKTGAMLDLADAGNDLDDDLRSLVGISAYIMPLSIPKTYLPSQIVFSGNIIDPYLFKKEELERGIYLPVDTDNICDVDDLPDYTRCYAKFGYTQEKLIQAMNKR